MRAAHSLKGAARIVGLAAGVRVAHAMEDCFVAAQQGRLTLRQKQIDPLLRGTDLLARIAHTLEADIGQWDERGKAPKSTPRWPRSPAPRGSRRRRRLTWPRPAGPAPAAAAAEPRTAGAAPRAAARLRPRAARHGGEPESPAGPGRRVAGRIALGQAIRRIAAAAQAAATRSGQDARDRERTRGGRRRRTIRQAALADGAAPRRRNASSCWRSASPSSRCSTAAPSISRIGSTTRRWPAACGRSPTASRASSAHGARSRALARQAGEAGNCRRHHASGSRHPRKARRAARPPAAQRRRSRHRIAGRAPGGRQAGRGRRAARGPSQRRRAADHRLGRRPRRRPGQAARRGRRAEPHDP